MISAMWPVLFIVLSIVFSLVSLSLHNKGSGVTSIAIGSGDSDSAVALIDNIDNKIIGNRLPGNKRAIAVDKAAGNGVGQAAEQ